MHVKEQGLKEKHYIRLDQRLEEKIEGYTYNVYPYKLEIVAL